MKIANLFGAVLISVLLLTSGICQANMTCSEMFLGGFTVNSRLSEFLKTYGEPPIKYDLGDQIYKVIYGNSVMLDCSLAFFRNEGNVVSIHITANNGWRTPAGISVGTNISKVFELYGQPDYSKSNATKTVCVYYPSDYVNFKGESIPEFGFFIKFDNDSGKILEMYLAWGFDGKTTFEYPETAYKIVDEMLKTDTPIEDFKNNQDKYKEQYDDPLLTKTPPPFVSRG